MPIEVGGGIGSVGGLRSPLAFLNPDDIASMTVLKDASATAIYGSRGANGVILIETTAGRAAAGSPTKVSYRGNFSASTIDNTPQVLNAAQFRDAVAAQAPEVLGVLGSETTDWYDAVTDNSFGQEHTLCIFRETCGDVPVIEHNGDFYSCDHFVDYEHHLGNIQEVPWVELLESPAQREFGQEKLDSLPRYCRACEVRSMCNGGCPRNRFISTPDGEPGLNYLCAGYRRFFNHCQPFVSQVAALWRQQAT